PDGRVQLLGEPHRPAPSVARRVDQDALVAGRGDDVARGQHRPAHESTDSQLRDLLHVFSLIVGSLRIPAITTTKTLRISFHACDRRHPGRRARGLSGQDVGSILSAKKPVRSFHFRSRQPSPVPAGPGKSSRSRRGARQAQGRDEVRPARGKRASKRKYVCIPTVVATTCTGKG